MPFQSDRFWVFLRRRVVRYCQVKMCHANVISHRSIANRWTQKCRCTHLLEAQQQQKQTTIRVNVSQKIIILPSNGNGFYQTNDCDWPDHTHVNWISAWIWKEPDKPSRLETAHKREHADLFGLQKSLDLFPLRLERACHITWLHRLGVFWVLVRGVGGHALRFAEVVMKHFLMSVICNKHTNT